VISDFKRAVFLTEIGFSLLFESGIRSLGQTAEWQDRSDSIRHDNGI
jgi:hypothetical protein